MANDLDSEPFSFQALGGDRVRIDCEGRPAKTLRGSEAVKFLNRVERLPTLEAQRLMAKVTGQFKFGNERPVDRWQSD